MKRDTFVRLGSAVLLGGALIVRADGAAAGVDADQTLPVEVVGAEQIGTLGASSVKDVLLKLPGGPVSDGDSVAKVGANLSGLPGTLVLVNGRRASQSGVDLNALPADAIRSVEILRDEASSLYGSDAVGAVVNVVLKPDHPYATRGSSAVLDGLRGGFYASPMGMAFDSNVECDFSRGAANPPFVFLPEYQYGIPLVSGDEWTYTDDVKASPVKYVIPAAPIREWPWSITGGEPLPQFVYPPPAPPPLGEPAQPPAELPKPAEATAPAPPATTNPPSWPKSFEGWRVPPWSTVQRAPECPDDVKAELAPLYAARDQARADWAYHMDHATWTTQAPQDKAADEAKAQEAQTKRLEIEEKIRDLIQKCVGGGSTTPPRTAVAAPKGAAIEGFRLQFGQTTKGLGGALEWKPAPGLRVDLYPYDYGRNWKLPGDGATRDTESGAGDPAFRRFSDDEGRIDVDADECDDEDHCPGCEICPDCECDECFERYGPPLPYRVVIPSQIQQLLDKTKTPEADGDGDRPWSRTPLFGGSTFRIDWSKKRLELGIRYEPKDQRVVELSDEALKGGKAGWTISPSVRASISDKLAPRLSDAFKIGDKSYLSFNLPEAWGADSSWYRNISGYSYDENDECGTEAQPLAAEGSARDADATFERVGLGSGGDSAWKQLPAGAGEVVVGVVDTGIDWNHQDLAWANLWRNPREIPRNGRDDDGNGYVDDVIGWDFVGRSDKPWDYDGHGTFVAGLIAATHGNGAGIDGANPRAKIMVLKALNGFGHARASRIAQAIVYGADNGARILNLSVAGPGLPRVVQNAVRYAESKGVLVIAAAGNKAESVEKVEPAGLEGVLSVAATTREDARAPFSNWGSGIDLAAPGVDVVSLRARRTDFIWSSATGKYVPGSAFVGKDKRLYRASGTSFAAPIVSGVASLVWSKSPQLTAVQVRRILEQSARDVETPGRDRYTGYGVVDARAALAADPDFFVEAAIRAAKPVKDGGDTQVEVTGTADADGFARARLELGSGEDPTSWKPVGAEIASPVRDAVLGRVPVSELAGSKVWVLRLVVEHRNGKQREARFLLKLG